MKSLRMKQGFTLVELMVVIVIIGILAALAIPRFMGASNKTKATEFKPILKQIYTMQEAYKQERDVYGASKEVIGVDLPYTMTVGAPHAGPSRFEYDVKDPGVGAATTVPVGSSRAILGAFKRQDGTDLPVANSYACVDQAAKLSVNHADISAITNVDVNAACTAAGFAAENL